MSLSSLFLLSLSLSIAQKIGVKLKSVMKLLDILEPGCNGVITNYALIPRQRMMEGNAFIINLLQESQEEELPMMEEEELGKEEFGGTEFVGGDDHVTDAEEGGGDYTHDEF